MAVNEILQFYTSFKGRATRYDFNIRYALVFLVGSIIAALVDYQMAGGDIYAATERDFFSTFWNLLMIVPTFAVICRRLHDLNYSGWWQIFAHFFFATCIAMLAVTFGVAFVINPFIAGAGGLFAFGAVCIMYLVFWIALSVMRGTKGPNKYGIDPLEEIQK